MQSRLPKSSKQSKPLHEYVFKAEWPSTALKIRVEALNYKQAEQRAWGRVSRMEGGMDCLKITFISQES